MKSGVPYSFDLSEEKRRIPVVEDEPVNQEILKMMIGDTYEVLSEYNGQEAMELIRARHKTLSLVLLDLNLPDIHGLEVLRRVKGDPVLAGLPVMVMTADSKAEVENLTLGAIDFIPKPYPQQKVILARILRTIELSENRDILRWTERDCTIKNSSIITPHSWTSIIKRLRRRHFPEYQPFSHHQ
ncbi:response regulator [[Clostridium] aminophilum]|uniref:response regulator n=1 Tax=[Clostridium] aminophilum TaxID=1526 RepID=UPI003F956AB6